MKTIIVILLVAFAAAAQARGIANPHIVGGDEAEPHQFPWQAAVFIRLPAGEGSAFCGGSLIHPEWVITAAHCVVDAHSFEVYLGANSLIRNEASQQLFITNEYYSFGGSVIKNDIALIKLPRPASLNENVQVVRLPAASQKKESFLDCEAIMSGWGQHSDSHDGTASKLRFVKSKIISTTKCSLYYASPLMWFRDNNICVSGGSGRGTCRGDSGGPLVVYEEDDKPTLVGITSFGINFGCEVGWPSAFARVTKYLDWIEQHTGVSRS